MLASLPCNEAKVQHKLTSNIRKTYSFSARQHRRHFLPIKLQQTSRTRNDSLVFALPILNQISQQILFHSPRLSPTHFSDRVQSGSNDFTPHSGMYELLCDFPNDGCKDIRRGK